MKSIVRTSGAPASPVFSQAVKAGGFVFVSGIVGVDPVTGQMDGPTIQAQTTRALNNCRAILAAAGVTLEDVVEVQVLLAEPEDFGGLNEAYAPFFPTDPPARSVARLGPVIPGVKVSIRMVAVGG